MTKLEATSILLDADMIHIIKDQFGYHIFALKSGKTKIIKADDSQYFNNTYSVFVGNNIDDIIKDVVGEDNLNIIKTKLYKTY